MEYIHPSDHKKISKKLPVIAIVFVAIIVLGFVTTKEPEMKYRITVDEMHQELLQGNEALTPEEAIQILYSNKTGYRFIDLRNPHEFINGHIDGALNIPLQNIFSEENKSIWNDSSLINILYAASHDEACGPWMLLKQLGHNNNRILLGGYNFIRENAFEDFKLRSKEYHNEKAKYDYAKIVNETAGGLKVSGPTVSGKKLPIRRKKKKQSAEGGCS